MLPRDPSADTSPTPCDRPFSLTPDLRFHFFSRSHRHAFDALAAGLRRGDRLVLVTGDLGVGKTSLCRLLVDSQLALGRAAFLPDALRSPDDLLRLVLRDLARGDETVAEGGHSASLLDLVERLDDLLAADTPGASPPLVVIDEAHCLPTSTARQVAALAARDTEGRPRLQILLAAQTPTRGTTPLPGGLDGHVATRVRLLPLDRDECGPYVAHRLAVARLASGPVMTAGAIDALHARSGGVARLVNLIAERALREAHSTGAARIDRSLVERAAAAQIIVRTRPRRFRWFVRRAS